MEPVVSIQNIQKVYDKGFRALEDINLDIRKGEIFALLGPNGAGKTTLINIICGIVNPTGGSISVNGYDVIKDFRQTRQMIGLVPQELTTDSFETVWNTVTFSRGLFGLAPNPSYIEQLLKDLSLWDKKKNILRTLSGGMKRRVMIAKALSHEPKVLFLDEPTAGVDVELRRDMWEQVRQLRETGVTIILTTHYIDEAEEMADRIGVISRGRIIVTEDKAKLMKKLGRKELCVELHKPLITVPDALAGRSLRLSDDGLKLIYTYDANKKDKGIADLLHAMTAAGLTYHDIHTKQSSLEEIFIQLVNT